jgi:hypothetical protein
MKMPWTNQRGPAKLLVVCATVLLVSGGLCGVQYAVFSVASHSGEDILAPIFMYTGMAELAAMLLSVLGLVIGATWLVGKAIRHPGPSTGSNEDQND